MARYYMDPSMESKPYARKDILISHQAPDEDGAKFGFYYLFKRFKTYSKPVGPYGTEMEALIAARESTEQTR